MQGPRGLISRGPIWFSLRPSLSQQPAGSQVVMTAGRGAGVAGTGGGTAGGDGTGRGADVADGATDWAG